MSYILFDLYSVLTDESIGIFVFLAELVYFSILFAYIPWMISFFCNLGKMDVGTIKVAGIISEYSYGFIFCKDFWIMFFSFMSFSGKDDVSFSIGNDSIFYGMKFFLPL